MGAFPLGTLAREMLAKNPVRALIISGGNPLLSAPNSNEFEKALKHLELCVVLDFYINETALHAANYILPVKTPLENSNFHAIFNLNYQLFPHIEYVAAAVTPDIKGPKAEWEILLSLIQLLKLQAFGNFILDFIPKFYKFIHKKFDPEIIMRILLFVGQVLNKKFPYLSSGALTMKQLKKKRTLVLGSNKYGILKEFIQTKNKKINLTNAPLEAQITLCKNELRERLADDPIYRLHENEFYLIGRRLLKTSNSWLHNIKSLWGNGDEPKLLINTHDAERLNLSDNERVLLENEQGAITLPLQITDDIMQKVLCYPHGWGHKNPQLSLANKQAGENINTLTNSIKLDRLSGMPLMNGYKIKLTKL
jgi:anaerobic selenocysteine-containing dehydrogenase